MQRCPALALFLLLGCDSGPGTTDAPPTATASASTTATATATGSGSAAAKIPYTGPAGTVRGVVRIKGDPPPDTPFSYPAGCESASGVYGKLFRVGQEGQLADAIVTVWEYTPAYIPPKSDVVNVTIKDCAYSQRSIALTDGQHIEVKNLDSLTSYVPHLDGARQPALLVAVPQGEPVKLYTRGQARYWLREDMKRPFMVAHVFEFPFSTVAVTGLDGRFEISGVPVGKAKVSAMLPQLHSRTPKFLPLYSVTKSIEIKEGDNVVEIELEFHKDENMPRDGHGGSKPADLPPEPPSSAAPSASPAPPGSAAPKSPPKSPPK
jgi:hypothetical protein